MRDHAGELRFAPRLPDALTRVSFRLRLRGSTLLVRVTAHRTSYRLLDGGPLQIAHHGQSTVLKAGATVVRRNPAAPERQPVAQPPGRAPRSHNARG